MTKFKVCVVGGHCSNRIMIVAEQLTEFFEKQGIDCQVITHGVAYQGSFAPRASGRPVTMLENIACTWRAMKGEVGTTTS